MHLTKHTDFSLRVLIFLSLQDDRSLVTINDVTKHFNILKNHLTKIVHQLAKLNYIETIRGKNGGIRLSRTPDKIYLGDIIMAMEKNIEVVDCEKPSCPITNHCELKNILNKAQAAFFSTLEEYTLADITSQPKTIKALLNWPK